jgi:CRP/FNR family transcriptional regulator, cyclic AMP receptor protein
MLFTLPFEELKMAMEGAIIDDLPFLQFVAGNGQGEFAKILRPVNLSQGETIFCQGDPGKSLYFVVSGRVKFTIRHDSGESSLFEEIGPGQFFGEVAMFTLYGQRTATAVVTEDLKAYELNREDLLDHMRNHPESALYLMGVMAERLRRSGLQLQHSPTRNLNEVESDALTLRDRIAQSVARFAGSPLFLLSHIAIIVLWISSNVVRGEKGFDPHPFHLLALVLGLEALVFSAFVLMNQYREDKAQSRRNDHEYQINLNAAKDVVGLHERLGELHRDLRTLLPESVGSNLKDSPDP